jgi:hypothetical protein
MGVEGEERGTQQGFQLWYLKQALIRVALLSSDQIILETFLCFLFFSLWLADRQAPVDLKNPKNKYRAD